jgi:hypothetical protein
MRPKAAYIIDGYQHFMGVCDEINVQRPCPVAQAALKSHLQRSQPKVNFIGGENSAFHK